MDYRKLSDHLILLLLVAVVSFGIAVLVRLAVLRAGEDVGTANLAFVGVLGACAVVYIVILSVWSNTVMPWLLKMLGFKPRQDDAAPVSSASEQSAVSVSSKSAALSMKEKALSKQAEDFGKRIRLFVNYAHAVVGPYIPEKDLQRLGEYVELYARNAQLPAGLEPIETQELTNPDLFHFGWNMWNHFRVGKQGEVAIWLKAVFANLRECEILYIVGKLTINEHYRYLIPITKNVAEFMADMER